MFKGMAANKSTEAKPMDKDALEEEKKEPDGQNASDSELKVED